MSDQEEDEKTNKISRSGYSDLLRILGEDKATAEEAYRRLRLRIIRYFQWRHVNDPEYFADETIARLAKNIAAGEKIKSIDAIIFAISKNVYYEWVRDTEKKLRILDPTPLEQLRNKPDDGYEKSQKESMERRRECLDFCLKDLADEDRRLILEYYEVEKRSSTSSSALAGKLGISPNALRIRVHRIKIALSKCLRECLKEKK